MGEDALAPRCSLGCSGHLDPNFLARKGSGDDRKEEGTTRQEGTRGPGRGRWGAKTSPAKPGEPTYVQQQQQQQERGDFAAPRAHGGPGERRVRPAG